MIRAGKGAKREVKDYYLSRFACYLIAQNGDSRKPEIANAQSYFATASRENELTRLIFEQDKRLEVKERVDYNDLLLAQAAHRAGVLPRNFGQFIDAGYEGLYNGLTREDLRQRRQLPAKADPLDYMGYVELAANDFRISQTQAKLTRDGLIGQAKATEIHQDIGRKVRNFMEEVGGAMPGDLPTPKESIKQLKKVRKHKPKQLETLDTQ